MARKNPVAYLDGAEELNAALRELGDRVTGLLLRNAAQAGAKVIAEEARRIAPRDEGDLAEGIATRERRLQQGRVQVDIGPGKAEWYGMFVELGTEHIPAQPFLRPAFDAKAEEAKEAVADAIRAALRDVL